ncbi:hypothetical protein, partial [Pseudomonas proteolytica]|uniref:hypothetical protein n=1 Tax=Pseudomonas proteolytica TaxID=219574 RepID=UPI001F19335D
RARCFQADVVRVLAEKSLSIGGVFYYWVCKEGKGGEREGAVAVEECIPDTPPSRASPLRPFDFYYL